MTKTIIKMQPSHIFLKIKTMKFHHDGPTTNKMLTVLNHFFLSLNVLIGLDPLNPGCSIQLISEKGFRGKIRIYFPVTLAPVSSN